MTNVHKLLSALLICGAITVNAAVEEYFHFDKPDETIQATILENSLFYDAGVAAASNGLWMTWLEFLPEKGDQLWVGLRQHDKWVSKQLLVEKPGDLAKPTVTLDGEKRPWVTFERAPATNWGVWESHLDGTNFSNPLPVSGAINHRTLGMAGPGIVEVGQDTEWLGHPSFSLTAVRITNGVSVPTAKANRGFASTLSKGANKWRPSVARTLTDRLHFVWDEFDGKSFNVHLLSTTQFRDNRLPLQSKPTEFSIASTAAFEAHAQIVADSRGRLFIAWEEDGENWGQRYLARTAGDKKSTRMVDNEGPLHRFRRLHFAEFDETTMQLKEYAIPQPSFELATTRTNTPAGLKNFGAFYENAELAVDAQDRPWIVYRHFYVPWIGLVPETHKQDNMRIYARCLLPGGWSKLYSFSEGQGDGMQRISVTPLPDGIAVAYTIGRTDRRKGSKDQAKRGVAMAEIHLAENKVSVPVQPGAPRVLQPISPGSTVETPLRHRPTADIGGKKYELFFGDMHRHTDISLCYSPCDGTIEDAYRYAIDAAPFDFLGITDHTHDLDWGNGLSLIWHRSRKEVNRHALAGTFIPLFSYERSRGDTDHNVFSLSGNILRPHTYPLTQFWQEIDTNTFTVAHQPFNSVTWNYHDDVHRPLLEIYQGYRNDAREEDAKQALLRGHHVGLIAASDHLSTGGSFACVWAEEPTRESIFRALQARRTFAATAKIQLKVTCGDHWMGERFETNSIPWIQVNVQPTAKIKDVDMFVDGVVDNSRLASDKTGIYSYGPDKSLTGPHIFYVRITQEDGNRAWSSPLWIDVKK